MNIGGSLLVAVVLMLTAERVLAQQDYTAEDVPRIENLAPLSIYLSRPTEERIPHYPFQRCSGLFLGYKYYTGATFDNETRQYTEANIENLRFSAGIVELFTTAERLGVGPNDLPQTLMDDIVHKSTLQIEGFAFFYDDRMEANYLSQGAAYSEDPLISDDLTICGQVAQEAAQIASRFQ